MKNLLLLLLSASLSMSIQAQIVGPIDPNVDSFNSIRQNGVSSMDATGDTLWISPSLNRNIGNAAFWFTPENADSVVDGIGRVFSLEAEQDTVVAGLGYTSVIEGGRIPAAYGYYITLDGGDSWDYVSFPLDPRGTNDTTFTYGGMVYDRIRITVPEQSPPYALDFEGEVIFSANWASGLLRSTDLGATWERVILPPFSAKDLSPEEDNYYWQTCLSRNSQGSCTESVNKYNSIDDDNLKGFGLYIDSMDRVWFGSAGGINISENALTAPIDSISWKHVSYNGSANGLLGNWIIDIHEEPGTGKIWMTNWIASSPQKQGVVYTEDGGVTFKQMLIGERINDIGFKDGYVFAAGDEGLFISPNGGDTWLKSPPIKSPNTFIKPSASYYSVATTTDRVWIGTEDGIASTSDFGDSWEITRVDFPLSGGNIFDPEGRSVKAYAYPNPFSPTVYELVRIKFELQESTEVNIRIFDFGMNLVRELEQSSYSAGTYEAVWNGLDEQGRQVANGPYFYVIETGSTQITGKILLVD